MIDYKSSAPPRAKTPDGCAVYCSFDKIVPISELKPNPDNPNTHGDSQIKLLGDIIESTGWRAPITVSKRSGLIVKGHGRRMAAIHKGLQYAPVEFQDYAANMIKDIQGEISTELAGYTAKDIENLLGDVKPDTVDDGADAEEKEFPAVCRPGDLWHLGRHRLLCGSATNEADVSRLMGSERANLIHTDPPYGISYVDISGRFRMIKNDHLQGDELLQKLLIPAFKNMVKYSADNAAFYIWHAVTNVRDFMDAMELPARAIRNSTKEGDLVMDLFGGSGSTLLAAEMENRRCYCTELDPKYCDLIIKRYTDATGDDTPWAEREGKKVTLKEAMEPEGGRTKEK